MKKTLQYSVSTQTFSLNYALNQRIILLLASMLFLLLSSKPMQAQHEEWANWFMSAGGNGSANALTHIAMDNSGAVYTSGTFAYPVSTGTDTLNPQYPNSNDILLAKFSKEGELQWQTAIGGTWYDGVTGLAANDTAVFIAVSIQYSTLKVGDSTLNVVSRQSILHLDSDGVFQSIYWYNSTQAITGLYCFNNSLFITTDKTLLTMDNFPIVSSSLAITSTDYMQITDLHVYDDGEKLISGYFNSNLLFQDTTLNNNLPGRDGTVAGFVLKVNKNDSLQWIRSFGKIAKNTFRTVIIDSPQKDNIYLGFNYYNEINLLGEEIIPLNGRSQSLIAALNAEGKLQWRRILDTELGYNGTRMNDIFATDSLIFLGGAKEGYLRFEGEEITPFTSIRRYLIKLNVSGNLVWNTSPGAPVGDFQNLTSLIGDGNGSLYLGGICQTNQSYQFACENYPDVHGGSLMKIIDKAPEYYPKADFTFTEQEGVYYFFSNLQLVSSWSWNFDDGSEVLPMALNPTHKYDGKGSFAVKLRASNNCGSTSKTDTIEIKGLKELFPSVSANRNNYIGEIHGAGFTSETSFYLVMDNGHEIPIHNPTFKSSSQVNFATFFRDIPIGDYHLVMEDSSGVDTLKYALNVEDNFGAPSDISIEGPAFTLPNTWYHYRIVIRNNSNFNYLAYPVAIVGKASTEYRILNNFADDSITSMVADSLESRFLSVDIEDGSELKVGAFSIPVIRSNDAFILELMMKASELGANDIKIMSGIRLIDEQFIETGPGTKSALLLSDQTCTGSKCGDCLMNMAGLLPVVGCVTGIISLNCTVSNAVDDGEFSAQDVFDIGLGLVSAILSCGGGGAADKAAKAASKALKEWLSLGADLAGLGLGASGAIGSCGNGNCTLPDITDKIIGVLGSMDPNEKYGIKGVNEGNYVNANTSLNYRITFENVDSATAPANKVHIIDTLDLEVLDMNTFQWSAFGFSDTLFNVPTGYQQYIRDIDLRPARNIILRFQGSIDSAGVVRALFSSLDPITFNPTLNILDGFLPPNENAPEGEGFISFSIKPRESISHHTVIANEASIIFDANEAIITGTWINTIDKVAPSSWAKSMDEVLSDTIIHLEWEGSDPESGILAYNVYASVNDSAYVKILDNVLQEEVYLKGMDGARYDFYVTARDHAGNKEEKSPIAEASTSIDLSTGISGERFEIKALAYPIPAREILNIELSGPQGAYDLIIMDPSGRIMVKETTWNRSGKFVQQLNISNLNSGVYYIQIKQDHGLSKSIPFTKK